VLQDDVVALEGKADAFLGQLGDLRISLTGRGPALDIR